MRTEESIRLISARSWLVSVNKIIEQGWYFFFLFIRLLVSFFNFFFFFKRPSVCCVTLVNWPRSLRRTPEAFRRTNFYRREESPRSGTQTRGRRIAKYKQTSAFPFRHNFPAECRHYRRRCSNNEIGRRSICTTTSSSSGGCPVVGFLSRHFPKAQT